MAKAKFDLKIEATRPLYAGVGVTDLAVGFVRETVADVQKKFAGVQKDVQTRVSDIDIEPKALRDQAVTVVSARRAAIEARVAELQADAKAFPAALQTLVLENVATVNDTYVDLAKRGETLVERIRKQESTKATQAAAATTTAKAKTTRTQAKKATKATTTSAKGTVTTAKKSAKKAATTAKKSTTAAAKKTTTTAKKSAAAPTSSAKATVTAAKKTASSAVEATTDAAAKIGD